MPDDTAAELASLRGSVERQQWFTTKEAAEYLRMSVRALLMHVCRGHVKPDCHGGRGRTRQHRFSRATLDGFLRGDKAA